MGLPCLPGGIVKCKWHPKTLPKIFPWRFPKADFPLGLSIDDYALQCGSQMCPHPKTVKETG